ncbi:hypothetical protein EDC18_105115 [Natranaerovirga pectinivora]|uniref:Uncharacterized protein n=1 Tax=Natranaerovirga pectinivora TaxID=682400 RepID=A0A4R3MP81_9FIRM|nr:hypothetical protein [Natranaerovirga pectinivora]TCT14634.1 hypothetical protein EDC18_105115 [Natranaerovirga pectinivora]
MNIKTNNVYIFLKFLLVSLIPCLVFDFINNKSFELSQIQILTTIIIAVLLALTFTIIFRIKSYSITKEYFDLENFSEKLESSSFRIVKDENNVISYQGNLTYRFFTGSIRVYIGDEEVEVVGTKQVLNKLLKE